MAETRMANSTMNESSGNRKEEEKEEEEVKHSLKGEDEELLHSLPRSEKGWGSPDYSLYLFQHFWCFPSQVQATSSFQRHFQAKHSDIIISSLPKSGTTWLKALAFAIVKRNHFIPSQPNHPLLHSNPHTLVPYFEANHNNVDFSTLPDPRLFGTHLPFPSLAPSLLHSSNCKILYICRNQFDAFISMWHFVNSILSSQSLPALTLEDAFEMYCDGEHPFGPFWNHLLGYWKASKDTPNKVLFLKYEDLKANPSFELKKVAKFLDCPFTEEEESGGVIDSIIELCSFKKMKEVKINKSGRAVGPVENKHLFRKGEIGDSVNYFSPWMTEKLSKVIEEKLGGSGLIF